MLSVSWWKKFKSQKKLGKRYLLIVIVLGLVGLLVLAVVMNQSDSDKKSDSTKDQQTVIDINDPIADYIFVSHIVNCKDLPPYQGATTTVRYCIGKLNVVDRNTKKAKTYDITQATHFYRNGVEQDINDLGKLASNQSTLALTFSKPVRIKPVKGSPFKETEQKPALLTINAIE